MNRGTKVALGGIALCIVALAVFISRQISQEHTIESLHKQESILQEQLAVTHKENTEHIRRLTAMKQELTQAQATLQAKRTATTRAEAQLAELQQLSTRHQADLAHLHQELETLQTALTAARQQEEHAQQALSALKTQLQTTQNTVRQQAEELAQVRAQLATAHHAEAQLAELQQLSTRQQSELAQLHQELETLRTALVTARQQEEHAQQALSALKTQLQTVRAENIQWQKRHAEAEHTLATVQEQLQQTTAKDEEIAQWQKRYAEATHTLAAMQEQMRQMMAKTAEAQQLHEVNQGLRTRVEKLTGQLTTLQHERAQWQHAMHRYEAQLAAKTEEFTQVRTTQDEELTHLRQLAETRQGELAALRTEVDTARAAVTTAHQSEQRARQTLATIKRQLRETRTESLQWRERHEGSTHALQTIQERLQNALAEIESTQRQQQELTESHAQKTARLRASYEEAIQRLKDEMQQKEVTIRHIADQLTIQVVGEVLFNLGEAALRPRSRKTLDKIVGILQNMPDSYIRVEGHTDNLPIKASFRPRWPTNWELSAARAAAVIRYLGSQGIPPQRLSIGAHSYYRPVASNDTAEGRSQNRRIEIILLPPDSPLLSNAQR